MHLGTVFHPYCGRKPRPFRVGQLTRHDTENYHISKILQVHILFLSIHEKVCTEHRRPSIDPARLFGYMSNQANNY
ncbi:MAG: hypothetical protein ACTSUE_04305 [Promethearchaeota archaeon]